MEEREVGHEVPYHGPNWAYDMSGSALHWKSTAEELSRATDFVWMGVQQDFGTLRRYHELGEYERAAQLPHPPMNTLVFLASLAIENLLKGIIVIDHPEYISQGRLRGDVITSHDLIRLAEEANIRLNEDESRFCQMGSSAIIGWGRYPIARNVSEMKSRVTINTQIYQVFEDLYARLSDILDRRFPHGETTDDGE